MKSWGKRRMEGESEDQARWKVNFKREKIQNKSLILIVRGLGVMKTWKILAKVLTGLTPYNPSILTLNGKWRLKKIFIDLLLQVWANHRSKSELSQRRPQKIEFFTVHQSGLWRVSEFCKRDMLTCLQLPKNHRSGSWQSWCRPQNA